MLYLKKNEPLKTLFRHNHHSPVAASKRTAPPPRRALPAYRRSLRALGLLCALVLAGCGAVKHEQLVLFHDIQNEQYEIQTFPDLRVQADDILNIEVASRNPETVVAFRQFGYSEASEGSQALTVAKGYRVDELGYIYLPFVGGVPVIGMRLMDIRTVVQKRLQEYIPDASVQVRFANFRVTVLGEVNRPNTYTIPNERINILEAIGLAGDMTSYARRDAILLIRERSGAREFVRINIQDRSLFDHKYFYLSPNDVVYVEPLEAKEFATSGDWFQRYGGYIVSIVSVASIVLARLL